MRLEGISIPNPWIDATKWFSSSRVLRDVHVASQYHGATDIQLKPVSKNRPHEKRILFLPHPFILGDLYKILFFFAATTFLFLLDHL